MIYQVLLMWTICTVVQSVQQMQRVIEVGRITRERNLKPLKVLSLSYRVVLLPEILICVYGLTTKRTSATERPATCTWSMPCADPRTLKPSSRHKVSGGRRCRCARWWWCTQIPLFSAKYQARTCCHLSRHSAVRFYVRDMTGSCLVWLMPQHDMQNTPMRRRAALVCGG